MTTPIRTQAFLRFAIAIFATALLSSVQARTWTSADGSKTFEGELQSYDAASGKVTVTLPNRKRMTFMQDKLSADDIAWLKKNGGRSGGSTTEVKELPDELPDPDGEPADMSKPVKVFILMGQSNMVAFGKTPGLKAATEKGRYPYLVDDAGNWTVRKDVRNVRVMCSGSGPWKTYFNDWLSGNNGSGAGAGKFGPEIGIGYYVGHVLDEPVLILKTCIGNRSLGYDLLPPSAVGTGAGGKSYEGNKDDPTRTPKPGDWYAGVQYDGDTRAAKEVLEDLETYYPGAKKFEVAGFCFWQGAKDLGKGGSADNYEENLVHFIKDLRKDFNAPDAPFVCATMGQEKKGGKITDAQLAVDGKTGKYPEFKDNVATFYSNPVSKGGANGHYGGDAETYMNVGDGMGRLMAELLSK
jgi:hypothetical protein